MRLIVNKWALSLYIEIAYGLKENTDNKRLHLLNSELAHCSH